ncbi:site-specific DNA-methyltransferase [Staphylococcus saprophyticus]|nr:site-specific DNA-methyltransferase [Staphylococcus saprophyticus]
MSTNILNEISDVLNDIERYWTNEKLAKQLIIEDLRNNEPKLITKLLSNKSINETYVQDIDGYKIFDKESLISMLRYKNYWQDSYTKYANKIGLTTEGKYLNYNSDVVLDFPFKDCILEGGMTKEDSILKHDEKFYNQVIAKEEIDTLLSPKVYTKIKKYHVDGVDNINDIKQNENLIIKGNNLIVLYSLKEKYKNKVKSIIIDPPYNTGGDSFKYNDKFNHATWLTFMKNRLEISKTLLHDEGSIWIILDDKEVYYLKVLCDSIFGEENFIGTLVWNNNKQSKGYEDKISSHHNYILGYKKTDNFRLNLLERTEHHNVNYNNPDDDPNGKWRSSDVRNPLYRPNLIYNIKTPSGKIIKSPKNGWRFSKETFEKEYAQGKIKFNKDETNIIRKIYLKDQKGRVVESIWYSDEVGTTRISSSELKELFGEKIFDTPKPENLIKNLITISSNEKDIVLDFFMGSATTHAVAHKMNRQYIGIEQMDYINTVSVPRLQKVIEGEQGGISKNVEWQGGGSFIYAELAKENQEIVESLINCSSKEVLSQQIDKLLNEGVLNYEVDFNEFTNTKKDFNDFELEEQKEVLIRILDSNQLYVNYSDIEDSAYDFSEDEIAFNRSFYGGE